MKGKKLVVYISNPLGFSDSGRYWMKEHLLPKLAKSKLDVINPWEYTMNMTSKKLRESADKMRKEKAIEIGERNIDDIKRCDVMLTILDGPDVESGTASEIGYAYALGKKIVGYRGDFRLSTDIASCAVDIQIQTFIEKSGGRIYYSIDEAINGLLH